ncbi:MAG: TonB-dependent receptor [Undibacterium sp.]|nr:TonB-dependent receptor [Undibacterium sp.]
MSIKIKPLALSAAIAAVFPIVSILSASAFAQSTNDEARTSKQNVLVTASRQLQTAQDVLADNVVISKEEIVKSGAMSVVDLLQRQRGIEIARNGGVGSNSSLFMRGGNSQQTVVLVDGVRIGSSTSGAVTWSTIPLSQIDHIEIVYGALSGLYGADAMAGVVQIFTKKGQADTALNLSAGAGSYGQRQVSTGVSGSSEGLSFSVQAARDQADGISALTNPTAFGYNRDKDGYKLDSVNGRVAYRFNSGTEVGVNLMQSRLNVQFDSSATQDDRNVQDLATVSMYAQFKPSEMWQSRVQVSQSKDKGATLPSATPNFFNTTQAFLTWQNDFRIDTSTLQVYAERRDESVDSSLVGLNRKRSTDSLALSSFTKIDAHLASLNIPYDKNSQYGKSTTGSAAYGYRIEKNLRVNASLGTSFRVPSFNDLYYPGYGIDSVRPEHAKNAEIGLYQESDTLEWSAVYYQNKARDLMVYAFPCAITNYKEPRKNGCSTNVAHATMSGLTLAIKSQLGDFNVRGSVDIQDPKDDSTGLVLARRSKRHANFAVEYRLAKTLLGMETNLSGQRFDNAANTTKMGGYGLLNLYAQHDLGGNWSALARWNNALNKKYELAHNYGTLASNLFVGVNYGLR